MYLQLGNERSGFRLIQLARDAVPVALVHKRSLELFRVLRRLLRAVVVLDLKRAASLINRIELVRLESAEVFGVFLRLHRALQLLQHPGVIPDRALVLSLQRLELTAVFGLELCLLERAKSQPSVLLNVDAVLQELVLLFRKLFFQPLNQLQLVLSNLKQI